MGKKIEWLSVLQGFSMLLVVIGHVSLTNIPRDPATPIATTIERCIYTFHMPLFIFISGWLFYHTCIRNGKSYGDMILSKLIRLGIPFLTFTLLATILKVLFPSLMHRTVTVQELLDTFLFFRSNPLGEMWFIVVLFVLMLFYPCYVLCVKDKVTACFGLAAVVAVSMITPPHFCTILQIDRVIHFAPFFIMGILCSRFDLQKYLSSGTFLSIASLCFAFFNVLIWLPDSCSLLTASVGIIFSLSLCLNLTRIYPKAFASFRDYTFQIFLMGIFFQMVIRWIYTRFSIDACFIPFYVLSVLVGIYAPVGIARQIQKMAPVRIKRCFGL